MFNPKFRLLITTKSFPSNQCVCLGEQLISIINCLKDLLPMHSWYGADVDATGIGAKELNIQGSKLNIIGSDHQFIKYCSKINQFIWGEFICIDNNYLTETIQNIELKTDEPPFRLIPYDGILVEIRMFDTSYIEIYSDNKSIMKKLSDVFQYSEFTTQN